MRGYILLSRAHIQKRNPILERLQNEPAKYERDAQNSKHAFRQMIGIVFDVRIDDRSHAADESRYKPNAHGKPPGVLKMSREN